MDNIEKRLSIVLGLCREPIVPRFYRTFEDRQFDTCSYCHKPLLVGETHYLIMKFYSQQELKEELAVCRECRANLKKTYSAQSLETLQEIYNQEYVKRRLQILFDLEDGKDKILAITEHCSICGKGRDELEAYFEYASCVGEEIMFYTGPSMVCASCSLEIHNSLSEETRENKRRFFEEHFGFPPPGSASEKSSEHAVSIWKML